MVLELIETNELQFPLKYLANNIQFNIIIFGILSKKRFNEKNKNTPPDYQG